MKLSLVAVLLIMSCAASQTTSPAEPWRVEIATAGGIAGRGVGTWAVDSAGEVTVVSMNGRQCTFRASAGELRRVADLLAATKPDAWGPSYAPVNRCCDRIEGDVPLLARQGLILDLNLPAKPDCEDRRAAFTKIR